MLLILLITYYYNRAQQVQAKIYTDRRRGEQADILRELLGRAKKFRAQQLVVRWGIAPWQQLMELVRYILY